MAVHQISQNNLFGWYIAIKCDGLAPVSSGENAFKPPETNQKLPI